MFSKFVCLFVLFTLAHVNDVDLLCCKKLIIELDIVPKNSNLHAHFVFWE